MESTNNGKSLRSNNWRQAWHWTQAHNNRDPSRLRQLHPACDEYNVHKNSTKETSRKHHLEVIFFNAFCVHTWGRVFSHIRTAHSPVWHIHDTIIQTDQTDTLLRLYQSGSQYQLTVVMFIPFSDWITYITLHYITLDYCLVPVQCTDNSGCFPRGKRAATVRCYPVRIFNVRT